MRVMKSRKVLDHATLCDAVLTQTSRFFPQTVDRVKRQIEKLINGQEQYLKRKDARDLQLRDRSHRPRRGRALRRLKNKFLYM